MRTTILLSILFLANGLSAQLNFSNGNGAFNSTDINSGLPMAVADMNADRLDDLVRLDQGNILTIDYQNLDGTFSRSVFNTVSNEREWTMSVADIDNNGYGDIMCGGSYNDMKIYFANDDGTDYEEYFLPGASLFAQGSNLADIDNDGYLDAFVCHDDAESRIWLNMKDKSFSEADYMIDMETTPASDNSGNYGSIWTDFDNDGDIDLYIAKCRQSVNSPTDPRRINALFVNDGQGNYTEQAEEFGLKIGAQSWTADFEDIDNDGDMDAFLTSHDSAPQLMENDGTGHFTEIPNNISGIGLLNFSIQAKLTDLDNDGFVDLLVTGSEEAIYHNNGDKTFTKLDNVFDNQDLYTFALGDMNHDGFTDIIGGYGNVYTSPSNKDDILWINDGNDNNWIAFDLEGTDSNRSAVGSRIKITGPWGVQIREIRSGESYGISNSHSVRFGIGQETMVDEVEILWPSGESQVITDLTSNQYVYVQEQGCVAGGVNLEIDGELIFCSGGSVTLSVPAGFSGYEWSNGGTGNSITVTESGGYQVTVENGDCSSNSNIVQVVVDPDETPIIMEGIEAAVCPGEGFQLNVSTLDPNSIVTWSNGETGSTIDILVPNTYTASVTGLCGEFSSEPFVLSNYVVDISTEDDTVSLNEQAELHATGLDPQWFDAPTGGTLMGTGNLFTTDPITTTTDFYVESEVELGVVSEFVGVENNAGLNGDYISDFYSGLELETLEPVELLEFTVYANTEGERTVGFFDNTTNTFIGEEDYDFVIGENVIQVTDVELPASSQLTMFIFQDADLFSITDGSQINFPYESTEGTVIIQNGTSQDQYDFFFNLKFKRLGGDICQSDRELVQAFLDTDISSTRNLNNAFELKLNPNPTSNIVIVDTAIENKKDLILQVFNGIGEKMTTKMVSSQIDLSNFAAGVYYFQFTNDLGTVTRKVIKQ